MELSSSRGKGCQILSRRKFVEFGHPIFIEDDCWIGSNVIILPGVRLGSCSSSSADGIVFFTRQGVPTATENGGTSLVTTIGAGSVVTKDVPPFSVAVGTPCRVKKTIPSAERHSSEIL
jgi:serine acetyltransferase